MKYLSDMYKGFMSGVGNLFSGAKNYVTTKVSEGVTHVKKEIGKSRCFFNIQFLVDLTDDVSL